MTVDYDMFLSLRFAEAMEEAKALKKALEERNLRVFLCAVPEGESLEDAIIGALHVSSLVVILGTRTYGLKTASPFSTHNELRYIIDKKPYFLVKMCDEFLVPKAQFHFSSAISYYPWQPKTPEERRNVPGDLVDRIVARHVQVSQSSGGALSAPENTEGLAGGHEAE